MIKYFCDRCGKEITDNICTTTDGICRCDECMHNNLTCGFKVGDEVITSTGKVGRIIDICTCDRCKERGFFEPKVGIEIGDGTIYITDNDKRVNFRSFYKIGNQVFGNIDEDDVLYDIKFAKEQIQELKIKLIKLDAQLSVVKTLK